MAIVRRENINEISGLNHDLTILEAQYRTLHHYVESFGFNVDYDPRFAPKGRKTYFGIEIVSPGETYDSLKKVLLDTVSEQIGVICKKLTDLGVKTDLGSIMSNLQAEPEIVPGAIQAESYGEGNGTIPTSKLAVDASDDAVA